MTFANLAASTTLLLGKIAPLCHPLSFPQGSSLIARLMGAVRNSNTRASHSSIDGVKAIEGAKSVGGSVNDSTTADFVPDSALDRKSSFSYLRRASERRRRQRRLMGLADDEFSSGRKGSVATGSGGGGRQQTQKESDAAVDELCGDWKHRRESNDAERRAAPEFPPSDDEVAGGTGAANTVEDEVGRALSESSNEDAGGQAARSPSYRRRRKRAHFPPSADDSDSASNASAKNQQVASVGEERRKLYQVRGRAAPDSPAALGLAHHFYAGHQPPPQPPPPRDRQLFRLAQRTAAAATTSSAEFEDDEDDGSLDSTNDDSVPSAVANIRPIHVGASPPLDPVVAVARRRLASQMEIEEAEDDNRETAIHVHSPPVVGGRKLCASGGHFVAPKVVPLSSPSAAGPPSVTSAEDAFGRPQRRLPAIPCSGVLKSAADFLYSSLYGGRADSSVGALGRVAGASTDTATTVALGTSSAGRYRQASGAPESVFPSVSESPTGGTGHDSISASAVVKAAIVKKPVGNESKSFDSAGSASINFPRVSFSPTSAQASQVPATSGAEMAPTADLVVTVGGGWLRNRRPADETHDEWF